MRPALVLAFANDRVDPARFLRSLNRELKVLSKVLADDRWDVHPIIETTIADVVEAIQRLDTRLALFHFGGHAGDFELLLQSASGARAVAHADGLAGLLGSRRSLQCVFLNGCATRGQVRDLLAAGVPAVIATKRPVEDELAFEFARHFYGALATGASLGRAFADAEAAARMAVGAGPPLGHRALDADDGADDAPTDPADRVPWELHVADGAEVIREWSLGAAVGDPLFGLPPLPERDLPPSPFRHLHWFTRDDAELFFGRGAEIHRLYESVTAAGAAPVTLLYGQSGAGKSSLLDAGLRPRLEATHEVVYARRAESSGLLGTLVEALGAPPDAPLADAWRAAESRAGRPVVAILDQVEEAFTRPRADDPRELESLAEALALFRRAALPDGRLVLGFRKEWLAEVARRLAEARVPYQELFLDRLSRDGIVEAVTGPARVPRLRRHYPLDVDRADDVATVIADDLLASRDSAVAPTLQVLLSKMWEHPAARRRGRVVFDRELYERLQRDGILLGDFLDEQLGALGATHGGAVASGLALDVLHAHTTTLGTARARSAGELAEAYAHVADTLPSLLTRCRELYLLLDAPDADGATTLAHDTLAPLVRRRYATSVLPGPSARRVLDARSGSWADGETGRTLDDADLDAVEDGRGGTRAWTADEERMVAASVARREARARAERRWRALGALAVAAIVVAAGVAAWQGVSARRAAGRARLAALVTAAVAQEDPVDGALLLATLDTNAALPRAALQTIANFAQSPLPRAVIEAGGRVRMAAISEDGTRIAAIVEGGAMSGALRVWPADGRGAGVQIGDALRPFGRRGTLDEGVTFSPDGRRVAYANAGAIVVSNADGSGATTTVPGGPTFDTHGMELSLANDDTLLVVRNRYHGTSRYRASGPGAPWTEVTAAVGAPRTAAVAHPARLVRHVVAGVRPQPRRPTVPPPPGRGQSRDTPRRPATVRTRPTPTPAPADTTPPPRAAIDTAWSADSARAERQTAADGTYLTVEGTQIRVWDPRGSLAALRLRGPASAVQRIHVGARGARVLVTNGAYTAAVWAADGRTPAATLAVRADSTEYHPRHAAISADESHAAVLWSDDSLRVWPLDPLGAPRTIGHVADSVVSLAFSADGRQVVTHHRNGAWNGWAVDGRAGPTPIRAPIGGVAGIGALSFSADGRRYAFISYGQVSSNDDSLHVVAADGRAVRSLSLGRDYPTSTVVLGADGRRVVRFDGAKPPQLWDVETNRTWPVSPLVPYAWAAAQSPDGRYVAIGRNGDYLVRVYAADGSGEVLALPTAPAADSASASAVAYSADGRRLFVGDDKGTVRVFLVDQAALLGYMRRATTACLEPSLRQAFLDESDTKANAAWAACERAHGRPAR